MTRVSSPVRHAALVVAGYTLLFGWLFSGPLFGAGYLDQSDHHEYFLPVFLAPITTWSSWEFGGLPAFADAADTPFYPPHFLFARIVGSWAAFIVSAFVLGASFTYAYVFRVTRSRAAAAFAGLAYALSEGLLGRVPHPGNLHAFALLPLVVLSIDRLRDGPLPQWTALGALALASLVLAGHPQPAVYTMYVAALYALVGGWITRAPRRYYVAALATFALGGVVAAVKALPILEASRSMARQLVSVDQFMSHAVTPWQLMGALFPAIPHDPLETPLYMGIPTLALALVAVARRRAGWRTWFWAAVAVGAVLVALGPSTPVAELAYHLPLYEKFRIAARHLYLAFFGCAVLAGMGLAAIQAGEVPLRRSVLSSGIVVLGVIVLGSILQRSGAIAPDPPAAATQIVVALATALLVASIASARTRPFALPAVCVLLVADLLHAAPYSLSVRGLALPTVAEDALSPSVHAERLSAATREHQQRVLAPEGSHLDPVVPGALARLWRLPIAGGYGPMLLERHRLLAAMSNNGSAEPAVLAGDNSALDLLAVRYVLMSGRPAPSTAPLEWSIGRPDCGHAYPRRSSIALPAASFSEIVLVAHLRCAEDVVQGTRVATIRLVSAGGAPDGTVLHEEALRAGENVSDRSLADPAVLARARHRPARSGEIRIRPGTPARIARLEVDAAGFGGWLTIDRVTVTDAEGRSTPLTPPSIFLQDDRRWREATRFRTSRTSDRRADEDAAGESDVIVYENLRARPRAWVVPEAVEVSEEDMLAAAHYGQLPDGRPYDPSRVAMVDPGFGGSSFTPGAARASVLGISDGRIQVDVETAAGGVLVLSEGFYPGWTARIEDDRIDVHRANVSLQAVVVPPGRHTVIFEFTPVSLRVGLAITVLGLVCAGVLLRPRYNRDAPAAHVS